MGSGWSRSVTPNSMYQIFIYHLLGDYFSAKNLKDNQFLLEVLMIKEDWSPIGQEHFDLHLEFS